MIDGVKNKNNIIHANLIKPELNVTFVFPYYFAFKIDVYL